MTLPAAMTQQRYVVLGKCLVPTILACSCLVVMPAIALEDTSAEPADRPGPAPQDAPSTSPDRELSRDFGDLTAYPILNIGLGYRSDIYSSDEGDTDDSAFVTLRAGGGVQGDNRGHLYGAEYMAERLWYLNGDVEDEDETYQRLVGYWGTAFDPRHNLDIGVEYLDAYDPRGQDDPRRDIRDTTLEEDPDTWTQLSYGATYVYGAEGARGRIEVAPCLTCLEYDNNDQDYRSRDILDLGATLYIRMSARTDAFVQLVYSDFDYTDQSPDDPAGGRSLDSEEWRYMVGANWMASEKTTGIIRLGIVEKEFDDPVRNDSDYQELTWDAVLQWTPTGRDGLALSYFRAPQEPLVWETTALSDDFIETEQVDLDWAHNVGQNMVFELGGYYGQDSWKPSGRDDDLWGGDIGLRYSLPRWGSVGVRYFYRERDSSESVHNYSEDGILFDFNVGTLFGFGDSRAPAICLVRSYSSGSGFNGRSGY